LCDDFSNDLPPPMSILMVKVGRGTLLVCGDEPEITARAVEELNTVQFKFKNGTQQLSLVPDEDAPEVYTTAYKAATNSKATVVEVKVLSALLKSGKFELKLQPIQDSISTCYIFEFKIQDEPNAINNSG